ncbi:hypothetical protein VNI00_009256 [Paramarasmius palmivorus]|uniref:DUF6534 domain-containing protein n=1 Tax=Paramarasmius palmivorus TaxID=297713 RepID=A0AAW0CSQ9_9AGAR
MALYVPHPGFTLSFATVVEAPAVPPLDSTMGAALVGCLLACVLYGVSLLQTYNYFIEPGANDKWPLKLVVGAVFLFDTIHSMLISHTIYTYLVTNYANPAILGKCVWSLLAEVLFNGLTGFLVQSFLTHRVWRYLTLSRRNSSLSFTTIIVTGVAVILVLAEFGCITAFAIIALVRVKSFDDLATMKWLSILVNALAAAADVYIAAVLCFLLQGSRTGFQRSDTIIRKLIMYAVNTGLLTSLCAVASLISITAAPNTFIYITFFFCIGRLYANSLLATLNARRRIRESVDGDGGYNTTSGVGVGTGAGLGFAKGSYAASQPSQRQNGISIHIDTITDAGSPEKAAARAKKSMSITDEMEMELEMVQMNDSDSGESDRRIDRVLRDNFVRS